MMSDICLASWISTMFSSGCPDYSVCDLLDYRGILIKTSSVEPWESLLCRAADVAEENPFDPAGIVVRESNVMNWVIFHGDFLGISFEF